MKLSYLMTAIITIMVLLISVIVILFSKMPDITIDVVEINDLIQRAAEDNDGDNSYYISELYDLTHSDYEQKLQEYKNYLMYCAIFVIVIIGAFCATYAFYLDKIVIRPFSKLKSFANRIADGNLDIPLEMDRNNLFGAFTEAFDLMREELHKARESENQANKSKKELVAQLSHDIKNPIASIKAVSELMLLSAKTDVEREKLEVIGTKSEQINLLITNMFNATLEELQTLSVKPVEILSDTITQIIKNSDYLNLCEIDKICDCIISADSLRLSQIIDNIIGNSYKYTNTIIKINSSFKDGFLVLDFTDNGKGVSDEEIPLLFNKFYRGENAKGKDGSGLGLYISKYIVEQMGGEIECRNKFNGFCVTLKLKLSA
ncbi:two-component sensor histidine kinase [Clostridia bacterium]|nr:two-component sensor histidine kinase [Clostridia bacterium]